MPHEFIHEELELFEDPCYVPDPVSLLGPVSESLDNFQLDLGTGFATDTGLETPRSLKKVSTSSEVNKPSPIECPLSRDKYNPNWYPGTSGAQDVHTLPVNDANTNEMGTWQMWNTSPLGQDGLGLVGGPASWLLPSDRNRSNKEDFVHPSQKTTASLFINEDHVLSGTHSPQNVFLGNGQNGGPFGPVPGSSDNEPWLQKALFPPLSGENNFPLKPQEETMQNEMIYGSPSSGSRHPFELSPANRWSK